jgi:hypothetical protein
VRSLPLLLGLPSINPRRLALGALLVLVALALVLVGVLYLVVTIDRALAQSLDPPLASLLTGVIVLVVAGATGAIGFACMRSRRRAPPPPPAAPDPELEIVAQLFALARGKPGQAALIAAVAGLVIGAVPEVRRTLSDLLRAEPPRRQDPPAP